MERLTATDLLADILAASGIHVWEDWNEDKNKEIALECMHQYAEQEAKAEAIKFFNWTMKEGSKYVNGISPVHLYQQFKSEQ